MISHSDPYTATYDPLRKYTGLYRDGCELSEQETAAELNRLRATIEERARMDAEDMQRCQAYAAWLRAELATAHEAIGQAVALLNQGHTDAGVSVLYDVLRRETL